MGRSIMCYSGNCAHELGSGKCGKRRDDVCPESFESEEDYETARQAAEDKADEYGDFKYEQQRDREMGI